MSVRAKSNIMLAVLGILGICFWLGMLAVNLAIPSMEVNQENDAALWVPIGLITIAGLVIGLRLPHVAHGSTPKNILYVHLDNEEELSKMVDVNYMVGEHNSHDMNHDPVHVILIGDATTVENMDPFYKSSARRIEHEGGNRFTISHEGKL